MNPIKAWTLAVVFASTIGMAALDADAAKRFGGGGNLGKQRETPAMKEAPKQAPAATPATPAPAAPGAAPIAQPQPGFMGRFGGLIAGLGIGALLGSLFGGGGLGSGLGMILAIVAVAGIGYMVYRAFASRGSAGTNRMQYAAAGDAAPPLANRQFDFGGEKRPMVEAAPPPVPVDLPPGFAVEPFLRQAKIAFIRLQAANDARDLDDIRDYTTPEMYAQIAMQVEERGNAPQKTEVVSCNASLVEVVVEGDYEIASVRYSGSIRESAGALAEPFDEVWHVRKKANDAKDPWLIAGIQQLA